MELSSYVHLMIAIIRTILIFDDNMQVDIGTLYIGLLEIIFPLYVSGWREHTVDYVVLCCCMFASVVV